MSANALCLAIDTSTRTASVALAHPNALLVEHTWLAGQHHTQHLLPVVQAALAQAGVTLSDVTLLAVATGPGSFNGLRVGIATVKAFAATLGLPIVSATALEVAAYAQAASPYPVCAIQDAGRQELAWAIYLGPAAAWRQVAPEQISTPDGLARKLRGRTILTGEIPDWALPGLQATIGDRAIMAAPATRVRRAGLLAELGFQRQADGRTEDINSLEPLYLRRAPGTG